MTNRSFRPCLGLSDPLMNLGKCRENSLESHSGTAQNVAEARNETSGVQDKGRCIDPEYFALLERAITHRKDLTPAEVMELLTPPGPIEEIQLWQTAHQLRAATLGECVHLRAIIEFSNYCRQDCLYCGLRRSNSKVARYRMRPEEMVETTIKAHKLHSFGTYVLQSGEDPGYPLAELEHAVKQIKEATGAAVTLSTGEMTPEAYRALRAAGADRFLLKFETSDTELFQKLKPTTTLAHRLGCLASLRQLGYQIGSGIILGLTGQDLSIVAKDLLLCRDEGYEMVSIGPFIPHPDTPLGQYQMESGLSESLASNPAIDANVRSTITTMAIARLLVPHAHMPATTALGVVGKHDESWKTITPFLRDARSLALAAGANVLMLDVTPARYKESYSIYPGKPQADGDIIGNSIEQAKEDIYALGMAVCPDRGDSPKPPWGRGNTHVKR